MIIVGIDEAGRGPLAGAVFAAAVILGPNFKLENLNDSKKLNEKERESLFELITKNALDYSIATASCEEINKLNILNATFLAMQRALEKLSKKYDYVLVDGNIFPFKNIKGEAIIKGDNKIKEIMAASILAKVARDRYMKEMDKLYPNYKFAQHKGYATELHKRLIKEYGPSPIHRINFKGVKEFLK